MSTQRSVQLQMRQDVAQPMIRVFGVVCLLALGSPGQAAQLPTWSLAEPPLAEIGTSDGVLLGNVVDAAVMADGSVLLLDWQSREILRLSPDGEVTAVLGGLGEGPGEFVNPSSVFAFGDTIVAHDFQLGRVTVWLPEAEEPETHSLPQPGRWVATFVTAVSARTWILGSRVPSEETALKERHMQLFFFDAVTGETASMGARHMGWDYVHIVAGGGIATYWVRELGEAQAGSVGGKGLFVPMGGATLEVWSPSGDTPERRVALPILPSPYSRDAIWSAKAEAVERVSGEAAQLTGDRFDGVLANLPPLAPPAQRIVAMGEDAWIQPFSGDSVPTEWIVAHPASGTVRATAVVDPKMRLLAGSQDVAVLLGRTEALEEQFVQLRRIVRGGVR